MTLSRPMYDVYLDDADEPVRVEVRHGDQLRGELEAGKQGLPSPKDAPMNHTTVWIWCALVRLGVDVGSYQEFKNDRLAGIEAVKDINGDPEESPVDPTQPAADTSSA